LLAHVLFVQAFVVFESPEDAQRACQKDRETFGDKFGDRYVRVYPTLESDVPDMQLAFQQQHMMQQVGSRVEQTIVLDDRPQGSGPCL
jgi:RNA recognition motif-containing protein